MRFASVRAHIPRCELQAKDPLLSGTGQLQGQVGSLRQQVGVLEGNLDGLRIANELFDKP